MAILVNEGLEYLAKLACGASVDPYTDIMLGSGTTAEANDCSFASMTEITTNGGAKVTAGTIAYVPDYKASWVHTFTFSGPLAINQCAICNGAEKFLVYHKFAATKNVDDDETLTLTFVMTEARPA
jgi:hypothetical protein